MNESNARTRPRWCSRCGARARVIENPYYGVGLAVHRYLTGCTRCGFVEFLPTVRAPRAESQPTASADDASRAARLQGAVRRWATKSRVSLFVLGGLIAVTAGVAAFALTR